MKGVELPPPASRRSIVVNRIRNIAVMAPLVAMHLTRVFRQVRLKSPTAEDCFMMADYVGDEDDNKFYDAAREFGDVVLVPPNTGDKITDVATGVRTRIAKSPGRGDPGLEVGICCAAMPLRLPVDL